MHTQSEFLSLLQQQAHQYFQRIGVVIKGDAVWQDSLIKGFSSSQQEQRWFCVGQSLLDNAYCVSANQGQMLLGTECDVLLFDTRGCFDANSFTAALGSLVGGGMLVVLVSDNEPENYAEQWMHTQWQKLLVVEQNRPLPQPPKLIPSSGIDQFSEQKKAVAAVEKVVTGHRKRPLVLTADRGRGKSSALGIACANLLNTKALRVIITAPSIKAVEPVYQHALRILSSGSRLRKDRLEAGQGSIQFIAPDELLASLPECDLLLVDEAAAIPVPMLQQVTEHYHRLVFSSTIHGYEGCGRGFTLKFVDWLNAKRPGMRTCHLQQPIRWSDSDPLEKWVYDAFVLNTELDNSVTESNDSTQLRKVDKKELLDNPGLLRRCFALLINAHYQTSPNDLLHLLHDQSSTIYVVQTHNHLVGVVLAVEEGVLDMNTIHDIQLGKRRPPGHLVPVTIINQLGMPEVGKLSTLRIMRIAVHPQLQHKGIGKMMLSQLEQSLPPHVSYLSTSFGLTEELFQFWFRFGYQPIRLGTKRDAASGCYSLLMVRQLTGKPQIWIDHAEELWHELLIKSASQIYTKLEPSLLRGLVSSYVSTTELSSNQLTLIQSYSLGGSSYESVFVWLQQWLLKQGVASASDLMICKLFLNYDWESCAKQFGLTGRKQVEQRIRNEVRQLWQQFTV